MRTENFKRGILFKGVRARRDRFAAQKSLKIELKSAVEAVFFGKKYTISLDNLNKRNYNNGVMKHRY